MVQTNPIHSQLNAYESELASQQDAPAGSIGKLVQSYNAASSNLLGYVLDMSYDEATIVTCDAWKRKCGGVPKNSFIVIRLNPAIARLASAEAPKPALMLARIIEAVGTPLSSEVQQTIFAIHKVQAPLDPYTNAELQWGALKVAILGTYYDDRGSISFGNDIDSYMSPHFYEVYVPIPADLELLANSFVTQASVILPNSFDLTFFLGAHDSKFHYDEESSTFTVSGEMTEQEWKDLRQGYASDKPNLVEIDRLYRHTKTETVGHLRYTETQTVNRPDSVPIQVTPSDFIANRTALFGKTRMGKSNTVKVIADMILRSGENVGQIIFDLNGEYSNVNEQDNTSLYDLHRSKCVRYSLNPHAQRHDGAPAPQTLKVNFYKQVELGHTIITSLWDSTNSNRPNYVLPLLDWEPCDDEHLNERYQDEGSKTRYIRARSMYFAALAKAKYVLPQSRNNNSHAQTFYVELAVTKAIRQRLAADETLRDLCDPGEPDKDGKPQINDRQPLEVAGRVYEALFRLYNANRNDTSLFKPGSTGTAYFEPIHECLLRIIGDTQVSGSLYLIPFNAYHDPSGGRIDRDIVNHVDSGKTVIIDLANADEVVARYYSQLVSRAVFRSQTQKFTQGNLGEHSVLFYFEEAHNLFSKDDKDLTSIYNRLAKEGAKNRIGLVYLTQSMTTLSPDLLKNTENFFIAHLNDDREIQELTRRYEFRDIGLDVQRCKTRGYVRMITLSHRYALPVQIRKFGSPVTA